MSKKIGVLTIGSKGAVATTVFAAKCALKLGLNLKFDLPSDSEEVYKQLDLMPLEDMVFGGWDIVPNSYSQSCEIHGVVPKYLQTQIADELDKIDVYPAILSECDQAIKGIMDESNGDPRMKDADFATTIFTKRPLRELIQSVELDIAAFKDKHNIDKMVIINLSSTEKPPELNDCHDSLDAFEKALDEDNNTIVTGMLYAYAGIKSNCHLINFTPSVFFDIPALFELAEREKVSLAGKDGKTGQTLYKTAIAPMLKYRALRLNGWYSTNILGNRDGEVLNDPEHCKSKIQTKSGVLGKIMGYEDFDHQVHIHYYKPRGDSKEAWDNIDFTGWFDTQMQMKIDWLGDDSILAAPLVVDLVRWIDYFSNKNEHGILEQLAVYFKKPISIDECDFFKQHNMLKDYVKERYLE